VRSGKGSFFIGREANLLVEDQITMTLKPGDTCREHLLIFSRPQTALAIYMCYQCRLFFKMQADNFDAFEALSTNDFFVGFCLMEIVLKSSCLQD
jgi:hypothetical protein